MSANIYIDKFNKASFFSARELPWHGLGQIVDGALTSEEALKESGLDFEVGLAPLVGTLAENELSNREALDSSLVIKLGKEKETIYHRGIDVPMGFATYRKDTNKALGTVGTRYTVVQNHQAFDFFDSIVGEGAAIYETAGVLGQGETIFITAKLPNHIVVNGEPIEKYIFIKSTHDGKGSIVAGLTPVRIVCNNTLNFALSHMTNSIRIRHTASADQKLQEAHKLMGIVNKLTDELEGTFNVLSKKPVMDREVKTFFRELLYDRERFDNKTFDSSQINNTVNSMERFYYRGIGQNTIVGTKFGLYNAVSGYYQNVKTSTNTKKMLESNVFGSSSKVISKSLDMLLV